MESSANQRCKGASTGSADRVEGVRRALESEHHGSKRSKILFLAKRSYQMDLIQICEIGFS